MLVLTRREGEMFLLGDDIEIEILDIQPSVVRIGIRAPRSVRVLRSELVEAVANANREAASAGSSPALSLEVEAHAVVRGE